MDLTLLWLTIGLVVIGFLLVVIGERLKPADPARVAVGPPSWDEIFREAMTHLLTGVGQIISGPSLGHRIQGLGSALLALGVVTAAAWVILVVLPELTNGGEADADPSSAPSSRSSPSPSPAA